MELNSAIEKLSSLQSKLSAYNHAMSLLYYDGATYAPKGSAPNRAHALAILSEESYNISTSDETVALLEFLDEHKSELDEKNARIVYLATKDINELKKIPLKEYVEYQQLLVESDDVWHTAKEKSDFELFRPYLERIFETEKRFASYCAPEKHPYDYCLNKYEEGLTMEKCDEFFAALKSRLIPLIKTISQKPQLPNDCLFGNFDEHSQEAFSLSMMKLMGIDLDHCALAATEHPFTTSLGSHHDVRITTNYDKSNFASSMYSVIHEGGHALYDMNSDDSFAYTLLDGGVSMGIHESQSRFYENILGRSKPFVETVFPLLKEAFPDHFKNYTSDDVYKAVNLVKPSLIRTEADEVTYCLHVMVRYELEKRVMSGTLEVKDLPSEWNRLYYEYLGVTVPNDREGVLQDSHWSGGGIGYFPSYALGSAYGAQLLEKMKETVDVEKCLVDGDFREINNWNKENIWKHGCLYPSSNLLVKVLEKDFDPFVYVSYLENKYLDLYK